MRRAVALVIAVLIGVLIGVGLVGRVSAQLASAPGLQHTVAETQVGSEVAYPPSASTVTGFPAFGPPGYSYRLTVSCLQGNIITFTLASSSSTVTCGPIITFPDVTTPGSPGVAFADFIAPTTPGTYVGSATDSVTGFLSSFTITVEAPAAQPGVLPATGSGGISTISLIAIAVLGLGAGLFGGAQVRRSRGVVR